HQCGLTQKLVRVKVNMPAQAYVRHPWLLCIKIGMRIKPRHETPRISEGDTEAIASTGIEAWYALLCHSAAGRALPWHTKRTEASTLLCRRGHRGFLRLDSQNELLPVPHDRQRHLYMQLLVR